MILSTMTGFETVQGASARVSAFLMPSAGFVHREIGLDMAAKAGIGVSKVGEGRRVPAVGGVPLDLGSWTSQSYIIPEGMIVRLTAKRTLRGIMNTASVLLRGRETGPIHQINVRLTQGPRTMFEMAQFEGRCDVLTFEQGVAAGARLEPSQRMLFDPSRLAGFISIRQIAAEVAPVATVMRRRIINSEGDKVVVAAPQRRRMIQLD